MSARSLRFYEDEGLIVAGRFDNGYRDYCRSTIDQVVVIRSLLQSGLPVRLIRDALPHLTRGRDDGTDELSPEFLGEVRGYRDRLAERIAALSTQRSALDAFLQATHRRSTTAT